jgi:hypothetical protein
VFGAEEAIVATEQSIIATIMEESKAYREKNKER